MNDIIKINGVACYEKDGTAYLDLETVARGLGFTQIKNGVEYVKWERVKSYLIELKFSPDVGKGDFIPENIFFRLAMKAKNETAEKFQAFIADDVLPSIRRHGAYITPDTLEKVLLNPDTLIQLAQNLKVEQERNKQLAKTINQQAPKVLFADSVAASTTSILVFDLAKLLKQNGIQIGGNRLFAWLREHGYLVKRKGSDYNMPTQKSMNLGLFEIKESTHTHADGHTTVNRTPKVTGKGQVYFISKFLEKELKS